MEIFVEILLFVVFALLVAQQTKKSKDKPNASVMTPPEEDIWDEQFDDQDDVDEDNEE